MEAFILKYITKQRSSHYCTRRLQLPQIHVIHSSLDQATFTFLRIILKHMCGIFTRKGFVTIYFLFSFKLIFLPWSMNHKNWLMKQKKSVNSNEPKRRDKLIIARDQNQTPKLQALFKRLFETLKLSSGNIPLSWLILIVHSFTEGGGGQWISLGATNFWKSVTEQLSNQRGTEGRQTNIPVPATLRKGGTDRGHLWRLQQRAYFIYQQLFLCAPFPLDFSENLSSEIKGCQEQKSH